MRIRKTTLAALCLAFVSVVAYSAAGDRYFSNPTSNKDVVIQVNKAGVMTDAIKVSGTTGAAAILGRADGTEIAAGNVGEVIYGNRTRINHQTITSGGVAKDYASITLTKGVWVIGAAQGFLCTASTTMNYMSTYIATTPNTGGGSANAWATQASERTEINSFVQTLGALGNDSSQVIPGYPIVVSAATQTFYAGGSIYFSGGTGVEHYGSIYAVRR